MFEFSAFGTTVTIDSLTLVGLFIFVIAVSAFKHLCQECHCQNL